MQLINRMGRVGAAGRGRAAAVALVVAVTASTVVSGTAAAASPSGAGHGSAALTGSVASVPPPPHTSGPAPGTSVTVTPSMNAEDTSCPTATSCWEVGNVSTTGGGVPGLFEGAQVGVDAYLSLVNALGGVDGRKFKLVADDDGLSCATNKADTQALVSQVVAFVGSFSLYDQCGEQVLAQHATVPDVSVSTDPSTNALPNNFSVSPLVPGMDTGPLEYFKKKDPSAIKHVGVLVADVGSATAQWAGQEKAMKALGYKVVFDYPFSPSDTNFTAQVVQMEQKGVQMVVLMDTNDSYGGTLMEEMHTQGFHPKVIWGGASTYTPTFLKDSGSAAAVNGYVMEMAEALWQGQDASTVPAIKTFLHWVDGVHSGFVPDLYTVYGWASAQLLVQALEGAGSSPTQASLLSSLRKVTDFDADGMLPPADPAAKTPASCYLIAKVSNDTWHRVQPAKGGYVCAPYYDAKTGKRLPIFGVSSSKKSS